MYHLHCKEFRRSTSETETSLFSSRPSSSHRESEAREKKISGYKHYTYTYF